MTNTCFSLCLCLCLCFCLCLCLSLSVCLSLSIYLSIYLSISPSIFCILCDNLTVFICLCLSCSNLVNTILLTITTIHFLTCPPPPSTPPPEKKKLYPFISVSLSLLSFCLSGHYSGQLIRKFLRMPTTSMRNSEPLIPLSLSAATCYHTI